MGRMGGENYNLDRRYPYIFLLLLLLFQTGWRMKQSSMPAKRQTAAFVEVLLLALD